jgi:hypothetical protein
MTCTDYTGESRITRTAATEGADFAEEGRLVVHGGVSRDLRDLPHPRVHRCRRKLFGLFRIDPIDDFVHLLSGVAGALIVWLAPARIPLYFIVIGVLYDLDALVGMTMSRGLLDLSVFKLGIGPPDFSLTNWALNAPHIVLATLALWIGVRKPGGLSPVSRSV